LKWVEEKTSQENHRTAHRDVFHPQTVPVRMERLFRWMESAAHQSNKFTTSWNCFARSVWTEWKLTELEKETKREID
jgi:hypothetical protein